MARPLLETSSPSTLAPALLRYVSAEGGDVAAVAAAGDLAAEACGAHEAFVTSKHLGSMLSEASRALSQPTLGLRLPAELPYLRYDGVALEARAAATPAEVLGTMVRNAPRIFPKLEVTLERDAHEIAFGARVAANVKLPREHAEQIDLYVLAYALHACRRPLRAETFSVLEVRLSIARPRFFDALVRAFGTDNIVFGAERMVLGLPRGVAEATFEGHDPLLAAALLAAREESAHAVPPAHLGSSARPVTAAVEARILSTLETGVDVPSIARALGMSDRTLHRRLEAEDARFSELYDRVREREARQRTRDRSRTLTDVAFGLGFSDVAAFSRAFKRWTGMPPGAYRQKDSRA